MCSNEKSEFFSHDKDFTEAQDAAKNASKGIWSSDPIENHIRKVTWEFTETRQIVDRFAGRPVNAIIESVRDGSTVRAFLLPDFYHITLMMSGIRVRFPQCRNFGYWEF